MSLSEYEHPSFLRRLGILVYDLLLSVSFVLVLGALTQFAIFFAQGDAAEIKANSTASYFMFAYYLFLGFVFYGWFWTHGGQTLGLRAWKTRISDEHGNSLTWSLAFKRYLWGLLLPIISQLWALFDKDQLALHERLSKTQLVLLRKL